MRKELLLMKKIFETPDIEIYLFDAGSVILTASGDNDNLDDWSPDVI